jgi:hypothetical protein
MFTRTCGDVAELPATSVDTAVKVCTPCRLGRTFQVNPYGALVIVAKLVVPSR